MKMLSVAVDERLAKSIDSAIASSGLYSSRSEFLKDAIRKNLSKLVEQDEDLKAIRESVARLRKKAVFRPMTPEERDALAMKVIKSELAKRT